MLWDKSNLDSADCKKNVYVREKMFKTVYIMYNLNESIDVGHIYTYKVARLD